VNIVVINHYAGGPDFGMEFRHYYLATEWVKAGHKVLIVASSFSHLRSRQPRVNAERIDGVEYVWLKTNTYTGNGPGRIFNMFLFIFKLYTSLGKKLKIFRPDLIIASSTYPLDNLPASFFAKKNKAKLCYEVKDVWPLSPRELGGYSKNHPFIRIMQYAENFAYQHAHYVVSTLPKTMEHMISHGMKPEKFCYIPNGISLRDWQIRPTTHEHQHFLRHLKTNEKIIVGYLGGHAISNALDTLLEVAVLAQSAKTDFAFVLIGDGSEKARLMEKAKDLAITNLHFLPPVSKSNVPAVLSEMDILYIGWKKNPLYRFGISPNKLMDYMMAAKPIVHSVCAANDFVADSSCGISVQPDDPAVVFEALVKIINLSEEERVQMGIRGKNFVMKNHNYAVLAQKFIDFCTPRL